MTNTIIDWEAINSIPVCDILDHFGVKTRGSRFSCIYKGTPNMDGSFDKKTNLWNCFWCQQGGNNVHLAAHMLGKNIDSVSLQESAIYLGELFDVGLTYEDICYDEDDSTPLPSLSIRKDVLDLIGLSKNPLLPASFFVPAPQGAPKRFSNDEEMFDDYDTTREYCEKIKGELEISKSMAVNIVLNHCHETLSMLFEKKAAELAICNDDECKEIIEKDYQQKTEQILELINRMQSVYERIVPDEEKKPVLLYEDYDEVFQ